MSVFCLLRRQAVDELAPKMMRLGKVGFGSGGGNQSNAKCRSINLKNCSSKNVVASILKTALQHPSLRRMQKHKVQAGDIVAKKRKYIQSTRTINQMQNVGASILKTAPQKMSEYQSETAP